MMFTPINFDHNRINKDIDSSLETLSVKVSIYFFLISKVEVHRIWFWFYANNYDQEEGQFGKTSKF